MFYHVAQVVNFLKKIKVTVNGGLYLWVLFIKSKELGSMTNKTHNLSTFKIEISFADILERMHGLENCST